MQQLGFGNYGKKYLYEEFDPDYDHEDDVVEIRRSNLRRTRNAHLIVGGVLGGCFVIAAEALYFWVIGVF